jgi:NAD(P)-dependent dehydrogenase (short-subunit alcohol dehydrogenase family)
MKEFENKTALVTGGAGGIGSAICEALLEAGCRVLLHDLPTSTGAAKAKAFCDRFGAGLASFKPGDLGDLPALKRESEALVAATSGFDFLINNAAVDPVAPIESYSLDEFLAIQTINAHAAFVLCQALAPSMKRKGSGAIVNIMSITLSGGWSEKVPYVMSKGALLGLTRSLARELGPHTFASMRSAPAPFRPNSNANIGGTIAPLSIDASSKGSRCHSVPTSRMSPRRCDTFFPLKAALSPVMNCTSTAAGTWVEANGRPTAYSLTAPVRLET